MKLLQRTYLLQALWEKLIRFSYWTNSARTREHWVKWPTKNYPAVYQFLYFDIMLINFRPMHVIIPFLHDIVSHTLRHNLPRCMTNIWKTLHNFKNVKTKIHNSVFFKLWQIIIVRHLRQLLCRFHFSTTSSYTAWNTKWISSFDG